MGTRAARASRSAIKALTEEAALEIVEAAGAADALEAADAAGTTLGEAFETVYDRVNEAAAKLAKANTTALEQTRVDADEAADAALDSLSKFKAGDPKDCPQGHVRRRPNLTGGYHFQGPHRRAREHLPGRLPLAARARAALPRSGQEPRSVRGPDGGARAFATPVGRPVALSDKTKLIAARRAVPVVTRRSW